MTREGTRPPGGPEGREELEVESGSARILPYPDDDLEHAVAVIREVFGEEHVEEIEEGA